MSRIPFGPDAINMLVDLLERRQLLEIELADKETRIRIVRGVAAAVPGSVPHSVTVAPSASANGKAMTGAVVEAAETADPPGLVRSQMVGIAYLAPDPDSPPFVAVGQKVSAGDTLLLVEAMKTFTKVVAPVDGTVAHILINGGDLVDFSMPLVLLE